jgi:hypothetical protein
LHKKIVELNLTYVNFGYASQTKSNRKLRTRIRGRAAPDVEHAAASVIEVSQKVCAQEAKAEKVKFLLALIILASFQYLRLGCI